MKIKKFLIIFSLALALLAMGIIGRRSERKVAACPPGEEEVEETTAVSSITLSHLEEGEVSWSVEGSAAAFKLTWSKSPNPTYPPRESDRAQYYAGSASSGSITDFSGDGTYYVRVCEYISSGCGVYSNEIEVVLGTTIEIEEVEEETVEDEVDETIVSQDEDEEETSRAAWYFDKLFQRLKKLELKLGKAAPSLVITPQQKATLIDVRLEAIEGSFLTVKIFGLELEVDASEAEIDGSGNGLSTADLEIGDRLLVKGRIDEESGVIKASLIHDRSARKDIIESIRAEIDEILRRIDELRARLEEI